MALIDQETLVLPSKLMYPYALVVLLLACHRGDGDQQMAFPRERLDMRRSGTCMYSVYGHSVQPNSLGLGDARLAFLVALGVGAVSAAGCAVALTSAPAMAAAISIFRWRYRRTDRSTPVALGPYLAIAGIAVVVASAI